MSKPKAKRNTVSTRHCSAIFSKTNKEREIWGLKSCVCARKNPWTRCSNFGRAHGVRHIVVGRSHKPWWRRLLGQSPVFRLVTEASGFDLHIVSLEDREAKE